MTQTPAIVTIRTRAQRAAWSQTLDQLMRPGGTVLETNCSECRRATTGCTC